MKSCSIEGCSEKSRTNGLCNKHALRLKRTGVTHDGCKAHASVHERLKRRLPDLPVEDCWPWPGSKTRLGYGLISNCGKGTGQQLAHRVSWELANSASIPEGKAILHRCDNPICVNPAHLSLGTQRQNMEDMRRKKRGSKPPEHKGTQHHDCRFTEAQIREIRASTISSTILGAHYGVQPSTIRRIRSRKTWKHLE